MAKTQSKSQPKWTDVKARLASLDHAQLTSLVHDLYTAHKDNQAFLHARFGLIDVLATYKETIQRWVCPDIFRKQDTSVPKAKQALAEYKQAVGDPAGIAELLVFYCESASAFCTGIVNDDWSYLSVFLRRFEQALKAANQLPDSDRAALLTRLDKVRSRSQRLSYGIGEAMDENLAKYAKR